MHDKQDVPCQNRLQYPSACPKSQNVLRSAARRGTWPLTFFLLRRYERVIAMRFLLQALRLTNAHDL